MIKKIYFIILSTIVIGFTIGVMFELDRKNSDPKELLNKIPILFDNLLNTTTIATVTTSKKSLESNISKFIVKRYKIISNIEETLEITKREEDKKKRRELCHRLYEMKKSIKQIEKNMQNEKNIIIEGILEKIQRENKRIGRKISIACYFAMTDILHRKK